MFFVLGEVLTMSSTKKRRFKPFSRRRKEKRARLEKQMKEYKEYLADTNRKTLGDNPDFKEVLTIRPLVLEGKEQETLPYVKPRVVKWGEFPVFAGEFKEVKKLLKEYSKEHTKFEKYKKQNKTKSPEYNKLSESVSKKLTEIKSLDGVLLLKSNNTRFLRKDYQTIVDELELNDPATSHSSWWNTSDTGKELKACDEKLKAYSKKIAESVATYNVAIPTEDATIAKLETLSETLLRLLKAVDKILNEAETLMSRFSTLSMKTRVLGRKTFYGDGYTAISKSFESLENVETKLSDMLSEVLLAKNGYVGIVRDKVSGITSGESMLKNLGQKVAIYNQKTASLQSIMHIRHKLEKKEFEKSIKECLTYLDTLVEISEITPNKNEYDAESYQAYVLQLGTKVEKAASSLKTLDQISTYYITLEKNLKSSALGRVLLLKDRYGHYLDAIQKLCSSLPNIF